MGRLQNKIWDPGGDIQTYDQVVMNFLHGESDAGASRPFSPFVNMGCDNINL